MKGSAKAGAVVLVALAMVLGAAVLIPRGGPTPAPGGRALAAAPSSSALLRPSVPARSLEDSIFALQARLRAVPDDPRAYASLGLAYVAQARVTADPSWYPKAEGALRESLRLREHDNQDALLGLGALALARHDFEAALDRGRAARVVDPFDADVYGVIGDAMLELGDIKTPGVADAVEPVLALGSNIHRVDGTPPSVVQRANTLDDLEAIVLAYLLDLDTPS